MAMADRSPGLLRKVNCGSGTPCVFITANGNGRQVTRPRPQSELRKRNAICVLIMELQANGNGRQVTRPPPHCGSGTPQGHSSLTFMCQNAHGQGGQLEKEKEVQSEWEARGGARKARGAERQWRWNSVSILDVT